jgi:hypothetical protein
VDVVRLDELVGPPVRGLTTPRVADDEVVRHAGHPCPRRVGKPTGSCGHEQPDVRLLDDVCGLVGVAHERTDVALERGAMGLHQLDHLDVDAIGVPGHRWDPRAGGRSTTWARYPWADVPAA